MQRSHTEEGGPSNEQDYRPLHFIWIVDCSGSMRGQKIQSLNSAIRQALPAIRDAAQTNNWASLKMRAIAFSNGSRWTISTPTDIDKVTWPDLQADGATDMGHALKQVAAAMTTETMGTRAYAPVLVLVSDGQPTDDYQEGIKAILANPWGKKAIRVAIGIGDDVNDEALEEFINNSDIPPLRANNAEQLTRWIRLLSVSSVGESSKPATQTVGGSGSALGRQLRDAVASTPVGEIENW